ncbi:MAG: hypothetical protein GY749_32955 [Desulfobacteraceae bacterium]|nr:hypothetical protein [Desulfobacteraceae bacterium]
MLVNQGFRRKSQKCVNNTKFTSLSSFAVSPDGRNVICARNVIGESSPPLVLFDISTGQLIKNFDNEHMTFSYAQGNVQGLIPIRAASSVAYSPNGQDRIYCRQMEIAL